MANEILFYISMISIGMVVFGALSLVMVDIHGQIEENAIELDLRTATVKVNEVTTSLYNEGIKQVLQGASSLNLSVHLDLPKDLQSNIYSINILPDESTGTWQFQGRGDGILTSINITSDISSLFNVSGSFISGQGSPYLQFTHFNNQSSILLTSI